MSHTKTIADLLNALTESMSDRDVAKAVIKGELASAITSARIESNMSQAELAKSIGKTQSTISKWEAGDTNFTVDLLVDIAADLDLDLTVRLKKTIKKARIKKTPSGYSTPTNSGKILMFPGGYSAAKHSCDEELLEM